PEVEREQTAFVKKVRAERDNGAVQASLDTLRDVARSDGNTFEAILECCKTYATLGEMCDVLREVWGEYVEPAAAMQPA
ncbi:MAG: methylmalonyl-CoA mutase family protein, partial [Candidatus Zixiibacteriota bacterium]